MVGSQITQIVIKSLIANCEISLDHTGEVNYTLSQKGFDEFVKEIKNS